MTLVHMLFALFLQHRDAQFVQANLTTGACTMTDSNMAIQELDHQSASCNKAYRQVFGSRLPKPGRIVYFCLP